VPVSDPRLIVEVLPAPGETVRVFGEEAAHARARRLSAGRTVVLVDGSGREAAATVMRVSRDGCEVRVDSVGDAAEDPAQPIHLLVAAVRAERMHWIAEKAAELGAATLTIVATEHTQSFRAREGLVERLRRIVRESAKQSRATRFTAVRGPIEYGEALAVEAASRLLLDVAGATFPERLPPGSSAILVGPEGGFTDAERDAARTAGWIPVALPAGVVRAETAAIAAIVLARAAALRGGTKGPLDSR